MRGGDLEVVKRKGRHELVKVGPWTEFHPDGTVAARGTYQSGARHGEWTQWYPDGAIKSRATYEAGVLVGVWVRLHPNGQTWEELTYESGVPHGRHRRWHENGTLAYDAHVEAGKTEGEVRTWHENGTLATRGEMKAGRKVGLWSTWDENGVLRTEATWENGRITDAVRVYDERGVLRSDEAAQAQASVGGKYRELIQEVFFPADKARYGDFKDYGWFKETSYRGVKDIPAGYWVYVFPDWFVWGERRGGSDEVAGALKRPRSIAILRDLANFLNHCSASG